MLYDFKSQKGRPRNNIWIDPIDLINIEYIFSVLVANTTLYFPLLISYFCEDKIKKWISKFGHEGVNYI